MRKRTSFYNVIYNGKLCGVINIIPHKKGKLGKNHQNHNFLYIWVPRSPRNPWLENSDLICQFLLVQSPFLLVMFQHVRMDEIAMLVHEKSPSD